MSLLQKLIFRIAQPDTAKLKEQRNVRALIKVLQSHESEVFRSSAAEALGALKDAEVVPPLLAALKDSSGMVQIGAANALGNIGGARAVDALCSALKDGAAVGYVARALASIGDASGLRQADQRLSNTARARLTFSRMSDAFAVQTKGLGLSLCLSI